MLLPDFARVLNALNGGYLSPYFLMQPVEPGGEMFDPAGDRYAFHPFAVLLLRIGVSRDAIATFQRELRDNGMNAVIGGWLPGVWSLQLHEAYGINTADLVYLASIIQTASLVQLALQYADVPDRFPLVPLTLFMPSAEFPEPLNSRWASHFTGAIKVQLAEAFKRATVLAEHVREPLPGMN